MKEIIMYTKQSCPQCEIAKSRLKNAGVEYTEVYVDKDPTARQKMIDAGHRSVPIFYVGDAVFKLEQLI